MMEARTIDIQSKEIDLMQIQVNASNGIENKEALERWADSEIKTNLSRFIEDVVSRK